MNTHSLVKQIFGDGRQSWFDENKIWKKILFWQINTQATPVLENKDAMVAELSLHSQPLAPQRHTHP
jgi:hypothetical protein